MHMSTNSGGSSLNTGACLGSGNTLSSEERTVPFHCRGSNWKQFEPDFSALPNLGRRRRRKIGRGQCLPNPPLFAMARGEGGLLNCM